MLHVRGPCCVKRLLVKRLASLPSVVQEVDVALLQALSGLTQSSLLYAKLAELTGHRTKALCLLLANAKLLPCQRANALAQLLELLALLTVNASGRLRSLISCLRILQQQVRDVLVDR